MDTEKPPHLVGSASRGLRQLGLKTDHLPRSNFENEEDWICNSTPNTFSRP